MPDDSFVIDHKLLYNDLVGLICERVGWNRKNVNLSLSILYDTMRNGFRRIAKIKDDASLQVLYFLPSSTYIDLYVDLEVAGTSRSHLEVGTSSGRPNVENVDYMEDDDVGGSFMEDGDHMEYDHGEDDEDYTSISDQSDENQSISEGSRESDEEVEDKFATKDRHIYRSQGTWDHTKVDKDDFQLTMWDGTTATIGIGTCFKNKEEAKNGIAAWNIEQKREFYVKESDGSTWSIWCKSLKESTPKGYDPCRWKVRASLRDHGLWEIVKWVPEHNCMNVTEDNNNRNVSATLIAHLIRHKVELDPDYEVKVVQEEVKDRMHFDVPYHRAWEGRRKAIDLVYGDWVSNFDILPRDQLSSLRDGDFLWTPYTPFIDDLPDFCKDGVNFYLCRTWIVCWAIREPYEPNRVLRQFQCVQTVPEYPLINDIDRSNAIHHGCLGTGKAYDDWVQKHTESSNLSDIYHLADAALRENPSLGGSLEDKLFQIFEKSFSALTLGPRDMSTQSDTQVLQKRPPESSQNVVLTQKTTSKATGGGRRKRPGISDRTIIVHPNPTPMQEDDENDEGNESDEDYYIRGEEEEEEEEEEESSPPCVSSQKKKKTVEVRKSDRVSKPAKKYTPGDGARRKKRSSKMDNSNNKTESEKSLSLLSVMTSFGTFEAFKKDIESVDGINHVGEKGCFYVIQSDGPLAADGQIPAVEFKYAHCDTKNVAALPRFKVQAAVVDLTIIMIVTIFYKDMFCLIGKSVYQLRKKYGNTDEFPPEIMSLVGKTMIFRVSVNKFNVGTTSSSNGVVIDSELVPEMKNIPPVQSKIVDDEEDNSSTKKKVVNDEEDVTPDKKEVVNVPADSPHAIANINDIAIEESGEGSVKSTLPKRKIVIKTEKVFKRK
ncbi:OLC1v1036225C1 [Oldenlandia corymbosa var. corymbosa]|uniref:OLC1v1036225C1 n=1 Tax=Oldenlandia corymbosa var. corymbosa TaxID=529605 RepID=A0AAV1CW84_OLDCO|nr:OLC1v1036225C1 [Oldenlandia corymbosa var. corymbosa]